MRSKRSGWAADAARKRRTYLRKKAFVEVACVLIHLVTGAGTAAALAHLIVVVRLLLFERSPVGLDDLQTALLLSVLIVMLFVGSFHIRAQEMAKIPYVPPVRDQFAALPIDSVLLRGCDQPAAASEHLLRPAHQADDEQTAELLRAAHARAEPDTCNTHIETPAYQKLHRN